MTIFNFNNCFLVALYRQSKQNTIGWGNTYIYTVYGYFTVYSGHLLTHIHRYILFEKPESVNRRSKWQHNDQRKKDKRTNNDIQNITQKTEDQITRTPLKTRGELRCSGRVYYYKVGIFHSEQKGWIHEIISTHTFLTERKGHFPVKMIIQKSTYISNWVWYNYVNSRKGFNAGV